MLIKNMTILDRLEALDIRLYRALNSAGQLAYDPTMRVISDRMTWWVVAAFVTLYVLWKRDRRTWAAWIFILFAIGVSDGLTYFVLKEYFQRHRPCYLLSGLRLVQDGCGSRFGFPSNHAATGMTVSVLSAYLFRAPWTVVVFMGAVIVGYSRIYLGVHFPGDILGGFIEGTILATVLYYGVWEVLRRRQLLPTKPIEAPPPANAS
jgi:undecaprenyl-diphosphatase